MLLNQLMHQRMNLCTVCLNGIAAGHSGTKSD